jgi:S1-C subfamily serine protease
MTPARIEPQFTHTGFEQPIHQVCVALCAFRDGVYRPSGTGVVLHKRGLAITAKHVIKDFLREFEGITDTNEDRHVEGTFNLQALSIQPNNEAIVFDVRQTWLCPNTDIALLKLIPAQKSENAELKHSAHFNYRIPSIGDRVVAFGYPRTDVLKRPGETKWMLNPHTSVGTVQEIHYQRRDSSMLNFPCYRTNSRFDPSMSGGPVFNDSGQVCGIVCTGIDLEDDEGHTSYVAALWPLLGTRITANRIDRPIGSTWQVLSLYEDGLLQGKGLEHILQTPGPDGMASKIWYKVEV